MTRGVGVAEALADAPEVVVFLASVLTQLGDLWFLSLSVVTLYWLGPHTPVLGEAVDRDRMAVVVGLLLLTIAFTVLLKDLFALPRPPWFGDAADLGGFLDLLDPLYAWFADADGFGFPSGHALGSTVGWGGMAWAVDAGRPRTRYAVAGSVVAVVSLTRLVLGVHFLVDVVVGALLGLGLLALVASLRSATVPFALAPVAGLGGVAMAGVTTDAAGALGLATGAAVAWLAAGRRSVSVDDATAAHWAVAGGLLVLIPALALASVGLVPPVATLLVMVGGGAAIVLLPLGAVRLEKRVAE